MEHIRQFTAHPDRPNPWAARIFTAIAVAKGGIVRRAVSDVKREMSRDALLAEVKRRRFHLIECGGRFIITCNSGLLRTHC